VRRLIATRLAEKIVKKILLAAAFSAAFASAAVAQTSYPIPPRDPPFGKGSLDNNTEREPSRNSAADDNILPRDPPFGKGELHNDPSHLPSSVATQSDAAKGAKKDARTRSALKKDSTGSGTKQDGAPKSDTN
jgi:hypothetical protein